MLARRTLARAITLVVALALLPTAAPAPAAARSRKARAHEAHHRIAQSGRNRHRRVVRRRRPARRPAPVRPPATTPPAPPQADPNCTGADTVPSATSVGLAAVAALCLVNRERAAAGLPALQSSPQLAAAAAAHSADMVGNRYFSHDSLDGRDLVDRIRAAGWSTTGSWRVGENIAWGSGAYGTPRHIVESWMNSSGHRANILSPGFREAGSGVAPGAPQRTSMAGATYTMDFGTHG